MSVGALDVMSGRGSKRRGQEGNSYPHKLQVTGHKSLRPRRPTNRMKFTGHERDPETGLDYMLARYYSAGGTRFLQVDPGYDYEMTDPMSFNLYVYVRGNPVMGTDPTGMVFYTDAIDTIRDMVGEENQDLVQYNEDTGEVTLGQVTEEQLSDSPELALVNNLSNSECVFVYSESDVAVTADGIRFIGESDQGMLNLDNNFDWRIPDKQDRDRPEFGVDSLVAIDPSRPHGTTFPVSGETSLVHTVFHELSEAFYKVDSGFPYVPNPNDPNDSRPSTHNEAIMDELLSMIIKDTFWPSGGGNMF